jgi:hypothetical protein
VVNVVLVFRSGRKAGSYLLASADDADDVGDADNADDAELAKTLLPTLHKVPILARDKETDVVLSRNFRSKKDNSHINYSKRAYYTVFEKPDYWICVCLLQLLALR